MALDVERTGTWHAYRKRTVILSDSGVDYDSDYGLHHVGFLKHSPDGGYTRFGRYLDTYFPEVAACLNNAEVGVLHLEVGALKQATRDAIHRCDWPTVRMHFSFVDSMLETSGTELHDAIGISYLGNIFYGETSLDYAKARTLMPRRLAVALEIIERHYEELPYLCCAVAMGNKGARCETGVPRP